MFPHSRCPQPFEQHGCRFIVWVLRHQFAAEGFGQERRCHLIDLGAGGLIARHQTVSVGKEEFDTADNCVLFSQRGNWREAMR